MTFVITKAMLQLIKDERLFKGLENDNPIENLQRFASESTPFSNENISQKSMRVRLFSFSLKVKANRWMMKFPKMSIASWEELEKMFLKRFFPPSKIIRWNVQNIERLSGEQLYETWIRFKWGLSQYTKHKFPNELLLQYFYQSLDI